MTFDTYYRINIPRQIITILFRKSGIYKKKKLLASTFVPETMIATDPYRFHQFDRA